MTGKLHSLNEVWEGVAGEKKIKLINVVGNRPFIIKNVFDLCFDQKFSKKSNILISLLLMEQ